MIGVAALVVGLLLILTWLLAARVPGEAAFGSPGILAPVSDPAGTGIARFTDNPIRAFVLSPIHATTWYANAAILVGFPIAILSFVVVVACVSTGASTLFAGIGLIFIALGLEASRLFARMERRRATYTDPRPLIAHPYKPLGGGFARTLRAEFADESRWRDVLYVGVNFPLALIEFTLVIVIWTMALALVTMPLWYDAIPGSVLPSWAGWLGGHDGPIVTTRFLAGMLLLPVAASVSQLVTSLHRAVVSGLLCTSESRDLRRQVETLRESRSAVLEAEAGELRRIERDLHDGAQQRLVMLAIDLGLASEKIDTDPEAARRLVLEGRDQAQQALAELRNLVRGMAPAILLDRGLVAALTSLAAHAPIPTTVQADLGQPERLPDGIERAAYFVVAESLTNVAKHSGASRCEVRCRRDGSRLVLEVRDDGSGGAVVASGGGLEGLARRVEAIDGILTITSPAGGPTVVRAEMPVPGWTSVAPRAMGPGAVRQGAMPAAASGPDPAPQEPR